MEIKDKLTARYVAMQMATDVMVAIAKSLNDYRVDDHVIVAKNIYSWLVGKAELPEVYDQFAQVDKIKDVFMNADKVFKPKPLWLPIPRNENDKPTDRVLEGMRKCLPIFVHDSKHTIVIGSEDEFDRRKQEIIDNADYTEYSVVFDYDMNFPVRFRT